MRQVVIAALALVAASLPPVWAGQPVAVQQLAGILASAHSAGASDEAIANKIARIDLSERLTSATLARLAAGVGQHTVAALELLADRSAFQLPPADEIAPGAPLSHDELHAIVQRVASYTSAYVKDLPNIVCTRIVSRFDDLGAHGHGLLSLQDTLTGELTVRDGVESFHLANSAAPVPAGKRTGLHSARNLTTSGEFGNILAEMFVSHAVFKWRRWETVDGKRLAVIAYSAPREGSRFKVSVCCLEQAQDSVPWIRQSAYQGEMSIDPASGAVLRVAQQAVNLPSDFPVRNIWTVVEYSPVKLGEGSFLLPGRSLSFTDVQLPSVPGPDATYIDLAGARLPDHDHYLNRLEFRNYHKFLAESNLTFDAAP